MSEFPEKDEKLDKDQAQEIDSSQEDETASAEDMIDTKPVEEENDRLEEEASIFAKADPSRYSRKKKNKQLTGLIAGAVCVALLVGVFFGMRILLPEKKQDSSSAVVSDSTIQVVSNSTDDVKSVFVKNASGEYTVVNYKQKSESAASSSGSTDETVWTLKGYDKELIDHTVASALIDMVATVSAQREMDTTGKTDKDYGLDQPKTTAKVTLKDGDTYTIYIGNESPTKDSVYLKVSGKDKVYLADVSYKTTCEKEVVDFASTSMVTAMTADTSTSASSATEDPYFSNGTLTAYDSIKLGGKVRNKEIELDYDAEGAESYTVYKMLKPRQIGADSDKVTTLLGPLSGGLSGEAVYVLQPTAKQISEYGLNKPLSVITYKVKSTTVTLKIAKAPDSGYYAVMVSGKSVIFKVPTSSLSFAEWQATDLYSSLLFLANITTVKTITTQYEGKSYTFELTHGKDESESDTLDVKANGKTVDTEKFRNLYQEIIGVTATEFTEDDAGKKTPDMVITVKYVDSKKSNTELKFTKMSDRRYLYQIDGVGEVLISSEKFDSLKQSILDYFD